MNCTEYSSGNFTSTAGDNQKLNQLAVDTDGLMQILQCGRRTAVDIGKLSKARINVGRRVLWNVSKIQNYIDDISE